MRRTKIICTIGPASDSVEVLTELIKNGMNVARLNFSHGDHPSHKDKFKKIRKISRDLDMPVAVMLDTKGPEIRIKSFKNGPIQMKAGQKFVLDCAGSDGDENGIGITYANLKSDVKPGMNILLDDGLVGLKIDSIDDDKINCTVLNDGKMSDQKSVNVPGGELSFPYLSEQDISDLEFGGELGVDFIAASFTRNAQDIIDIRELLKKHNSKAKIIAKIESTQGIKNIDEIIDAADGIMVARGDMGVELPFEDVPVIQKELIKKTNAAGKYVITATQMLDSMIKNPRPTRAEITDVANAIYDGTTATMLSGESASGAYPVESLKTMAIIAERTERAIDYVKRLGKLSINSECERDITTAISHATCTVAAEIKADGIITVSMSGYTCERISRYKPCCKIIGCTTEPMVARQMTLMWGVAPLLIRKEDSEEELFDEAVSSAKAAGLIKTGDKVVLTAGVPLGVSGNTNMLRVIEVE